MISYIPRILKRTEYRDIRSHQEFFTAMDVKQLKSRLTLFGAATAFATLLSIISIILPYWMKIESDGHIGVYESQSENGKSLFSTECDSNMSQIECGYLGSAKISSVVSIIFGGLATVVYYLPPKVFTSLPAFLAVSGSLGQFIFGLITIVLFAYFKRDYFTDDGINREYPSPDADDLSFQVGFYLWMVATIISFIVVSLGYAILSKTGCIENSRSLSNTASPLGDYMVVSNKE